MNRDCAIWREGEEERGLTQACSLGARPKCKRRATLRGVTRRPMGVSFHQAGCRFEGRESATTNLHVNLRLGG